MGHSRPGPHGVWSRPGVATTNIRPQDSAERARIKEAIAAKLVGRWHDGTSLVRNPLMPGANVQAPDRGFLFGAEDPSGLACPFGSHIRRANPRDSRFPGSKEEIATINRHRILRVGRSYGTPHQSDESAFDWSKSHGLLFMCVNVDIERQFEFVQKTWLLNPSMHGLENEIDPLLGCEAMRAKRRLTVPTPTGPVQLTDIPDLVHMRGGGYFFLPGRNALRYLWARTAEEVSKAHDLGAGGRADVPRSPAIAVSEERLDVAQLETTMLATAEAPTASFHGEVQPGD